MANWAFVENGEIKELHDWLPPNWRHVSGLNLAENDTDFLRSLGWVRVVKQPETYDAMRFWVSSVSHAIVNDEVIETQQLSEVVPVQNGRLPFHDASLIGLRQYRNELLQASDWTQLPDVQNILGVTEKELWAQYRQALRDLPNLYQQHGDMGLLTWPQPPGE
jgi:hypothetical protein